MKINQIIKEKNISKYRLAKDSGIPYTTVNDICSGRVNLAECNAGTIYKLSKALHISMEEMIEPYMILRPSFELFKSNVCHRLKELGDIEFVIDTIESDEIEIYHQRDWYPECLYLLAMLDYVSRINEIPLCDEYDRLRQMKLQEVLYPAGIISSYLVSGNDEIKKKAIEESIPEFIRFNIVESEVWDVI